MNTPPIADFSVAGELAATSVVSLDGSASRDPDRGDAITSYAWSIEPDGAPCAAPEVASTDPVVQVRFGCAGRFRARLIVLDSKHLESAPATRALDVQARSGPALVEAGPDQTVEHLCSGAPVTCRLSVPVQLTAATSAQAPVSFHWSVQPPAGRGPDEHRRVRFIPDASAQSPAVEIETDGTAISGDWQFRIEMRDGVGVLDADVTRVSVANHAPVIRGGPSGAFDHVFDPTTQLFISGGSFPVEVIDPDGDPVDRQVAFHHAGDGGAAFIGEDLGTAIRFSVAVPFGKPEDALFLRGAEGLDRSVALTVKDVNGGSASHDFRVLIGNRPPVQARAGELAAPHTYDGIARLFVSQAVLGQWVDPDGDPLAYVVEADPECASFSAQVDGTVRLRCSRPFTGMASLASFLQPRQARIEARDAWTSTLTSLSFQIGNRAPLAAPRTFQPVMSCQFREMAGPWCPGTGSAPERSNLFPATIVSAPCGVSDPDGDPLEVTSGSGVATSCGPDQPCNLTVLIPQSVSCSFSPPDLRVPFAATDGVASSSGSVLVDPRCR